MPPPFLPDTKSKIPNAEKEMLDPTVFNLTDPGGFYVADGSETNVCVCECMGLERGDVWECVCPCIFLF